MKYLINGVITKNCKKKIAVVIMIFFLDFTHIVIMKTDIYTHTHVCSLVTFNLMDHKSKLFTFINKSPAWQHLDYHNFKDTNRMRSKLYWYINANKHTHN